MDFSTAPTNDQHIPNGTADLNVPNNTLDNAATAPPCSSKLPDTEEMMSHILDDGSGTGQDVPFQPTPEQSLRAAELLLKANKQIRLPMLRILRQGGFDVGDVDALADGPATDAEDKLMDEFSRDILSRAQWDLLPIRFVVGLFNKWLKTHYPNIPEYTWKRIKVALVPQASKYGWIFLEDKNGKPKRDRPGDRMSSEEPLIEELDMDEWRGFIPDPTKTYAGLRRKLKRKLREEKEN